MGVVRNGRRFCWVRNAVDAALLVCGFPGLFRFGGSLYTVVLVWMIIDVEESARMRANLMRNTLMKSIQM